MHKNGFLLGVIFLFYLTFERYILLQHLQMHHQCYENALITIDEEDDNHDDDDVVALPV